MNTLELFTEHIYGIFVPGLVKRQDALFAMDLFSKNPNVHCHDICYYHYRMHMDSVCRKYNPRGYGMGRDIYETCQ
jgi:hypothetical protein